MLGYESIEGVPVTFNKWLLTDKLRGAWKYNGTLITDWDNVGRSVWEQHVKPDYVHAAADAVKAGNDLVMTTPQFYEGAIEAVKTGLLDESLIDDAVSRILALKFRLGLFEDPRLPDAERIKRSSVPPNTSRPTWNSPANPSPCCATTAPCRSPRTRPSASPW